MVHDPTTLLPPLLVISYRLETRDNCRYVVGWYTGKNPRPSQPFCILSSRDPEVSFVILILISVKALWLQQAYALEFLGKSTFIPGLFAAGLAFFAVNCWILGIIVQDVGTQPAKPIGKLSDKEGGISRDDTT